MSKGFGISLVAFLAVVPMVANAEGERVLSKFGTGNVVSSSDLATTSYVDGAYKATTDKIDLLIDDTAVTVNGNYIDKDKSVSANLKELDTALKTVAENSGNSAEIGVLANLETTEKGTLVGAINEVNSLADKEISYVSKWATPEVVQTKKLADLN